MRAIFADDSVHRTAGFILCGVVFADESIQTAVAEALRRAGLAPGSDEFKSGVRMDGTPTLQELRTELMSIVHSNCRIGVVVAPEQRRKDIGEIALRGVDYMLASSTFAEAPHRVYLDEGMFPSRTSARTVVLGIAGLAQQDVLPEQDSRNVLGIQLADLVAHTCSVMLLAHMGLKVKTVKAGENSGYDPDDDLELEFALWAGIRYAFLSRPDPSRPAEEPLLDATPGLYIDPSCSPQLTAAARERFSTVWVGCIH